MGDWLAEPAVWLVLDHETAAPRSLSEVTGAALDGGIRHVVFRDKSRPRAALLPDATAVREICLKRSARFILSHLTELVETLEPDALHLGAGGKPLTEVARQYAARLPLGYSAHSITEVRLALSAGASYCFLGPIFPSPRKLAYGRPLGLEAAEEAVRFNLPCVFIGGIDQERAQQLAGIGATRVAVIRALQEPADIAAAARSMVGTILQ